MLRATTSALSLPVLTDSDVRRFWSKVDKTGSAAGCWLWTAGLSHGYGAFAIKSKRHGAHKVSFLLNGGVLTEEKPWALHSCHNPRCVNPAHLKAGDRQDNADDMVLAGRQCKGEIKSAIARLVAPRGDDHPSRRKPECLRRGNNHPAHLHPERQPRGEQNKNSKLTAEKVRVIRSKYSAGGISQREFAVDQTVIGDVVGGKTWRHVA